MTELHKKRQLWRWNIFIVDCILVELYLRSSHRETWRKRIFMKSAHKMCRFFLYDEIVQKNYDILAGLNWATLPFSLSLSISMCFFFCCACAMCMSRTAIHLSIFVCFINIDLYLRNEIVKQRAKYRDVKYGFTFGEKRITAWSLFCSVIFSIVLNEKKDTIASFDTKLDFPKV